MECVRARPLWLCGTQPPAPDPELWTRSAGQGQGRHHATIGLRRGIHARHTYPAPPVFRTPPSSLRASLSGRPPQPGPYPVRTVTRAAR